MSSCCLRGDNFLNNGCAQGICPKYKSVGAKAIAPVPICQFDTSNIPWVHSFTPTVLLYAKENVTLNDCISWNYLYFKLATIL